jgi:hypothetical protein
MPLLQQQQLLLLLHQRRRRSHRRMNRDRVVALYNGWRRTDSARDRRSNDSIRHDGCVINSRQPGGPIVRRIQEQTDEGREGRERTRERGPKAATPAEAADARDPQLSPVATVKCNSKCACVRVRACVNVRGVKRELAYTDVACVRRTAVRLDIGSCQNVSEETVGGECVTRTDVAGGGGILWTLNGVSANSAESCAAVARDMLFDIAPGKTVCEMLCRKVRANLGAFCRIKLGL